MRRRRAVVISVTDDGHPVVAARRVLMAATPEFAAAWKMILVCPFCGRVHVHGLGASVEFSMPGSGDGTWVPHCPSSSDEKPITYHLQECRDRDMAGDFPRRILDAIVEYCRPALGVSYHTAVVGSRRA